MQYIHIIMMVYAITNAQKIHIKMMENINVKIIQINAFILKKNYTR